MFSALLIVSSASAKGMQAVLTDDADRTTAFAWEGSYRTNRTIDQREICDQRRVRFASARLQTCKEISPLSQNYIRLKTGCPIIYSLGAVVAINPRRTSSAEGVPRTESGRKGTRRLNGAVSDDDAGHHRVYVPPPTRQ